MKFLILFSSLLLFSCSSQSNDNQFLSLNEECELSGSEDSKQCKIIAMDDLTQNEKEHLMGYIYFFADETPMEDCEKARYWFEKAADQENAQAINLLGVVHFTGCGVDKDYKKAEEYFLLANDKGSKQAKVNLGELYREGGFGIEQNYDKALYWYQLGIADEPARAYNGLSLVYIDQGKYEQAYEYVVQAADLEYTEAQYNLGYYYDSGTFVEQDNEKAKYWYEKAAEKGWAAAKRNLALLLEEMKEQTD
ncbi:tetratricopeptide repeat protein [Psychrobacter sp. AOP22-C1-22]|uniref:tetratricopeptide repeat protein n=1 Tax=unclassified Psychrobacter TaxID=196806 RepID=UPI00178824E7|nr:tetratricopeptide repeat protein [Psychrobacter sp. FME6]MBE0405863.1 sel1 repeat family protein [Psychrobacter sp. FME6]